MTGTSSVEVEVTERPSVLESRRRDLSNPLTERMVLTGPDAWLCGWHVASAVPPDQLMVRWRSIERLSLDDIQCQERLSQISEVRIGTPLGGTSETIVPGQGPCVGWSDGHPPQSRASLTPRGERYAGHPTTETHFVTSGISTWVNRSRSGTVPRQKGARAGMT